LKNLVNSTNRAGGEEGGKEGACDHVSWDRVRRK